MVWKTESLMAQGQSRRAGTKGRRRAMLMPTATRAPEIRKRAPANAMMEATSVDAIPKRP